MYSQNWGRWTHNIISSLKEPNLDKDNKSQAVTTQVTLGCKIRHPSAVHYAHFFQFGDKLHQQTAQFTKLIDELLNHHNT